jgi:hypothetical protein
LAALLIAVAMILMVVLPLPWPIYPVSSKRDPRLALPMQRNVARSVLSVCCLVKKVVTEGSSIARMPERHGGWSEFS